MTKLFKDKRFLAVICFIVGILFTKVFLNPSKSIKEEVTKELSSEYNKEINKLKEDFYKKESSYQVQIKEEEENRKEFEKQSSSKIQKLTTENRQLKESSKRKKFKLIKPDGTIIEKEYEETNREEVTSIVTEIREEFNEKIKSTEERYKKAFTERLKKIKEQQDQKIASIEQENLKKFEKFKKQSEIKINEKKVRASVGVTTDKEIRLQGNYNFAPPFTVGIGVDIDKDGKVNEMANEFSLDFGFEF